MCLPLMLYSEAKITILGDNSNILLLDSKILKSSPKRNHLSSKIKDTNVLAGEYLIFEELKQSKTYVK